MSEGVDSMSEGEMRANGKRSQAKERENPKAKLIALDAESWANIVDTDKDWDVPEEDRPSSSASSAKGAKAKNVAPGEKKRSKGRSRASSKEASRAKEVQTIKTAAAAAASPAADAAAAAAAAAAVAPAAGAAGAAVAAAAKEGTFVAPARLKRSFSDREWGGKRCRCCRDGRHPCGYHEDVPRIKPYRGHQDAIIGKPQRGDRRSPADPDWSS